MRARAGNKLKKLLGGVLTLSMLLSGLYVSPVAAEGPEEAQGDPQPIAESVSDNDPVRAMSLDSGIMPIADGAGVYVLDATADLQAFTKGQKQNGDEDKAGTENYFTLIWSTNSAVNGSSKKFEDDYEGTQRVNFGGKMDVSNNKNAVRFTTSGAATVKIWWAEGGDDNRQMVIKDAGGAEIAKTDETLAANIACISTLKIPGAGTYYLGGDTGNNYIFKVVVEEEQEIKETVRTLDATADLQAFTKGQKQNGDEDKAGTENYFTLIWSTNSAVNGSSKKFEDNYEGTQRINFGGKMDVSNNKNAVRFTTSGAATVKIWWAEGGDDNRQMVIKDAGGAEIAKTDETLAANIACISTLKISGAGTYYLGGDTGNNYIFKIEVTETSGGTKPPRKAWSEVAEPSVESVALNAEDSGKVDVIVAASVGYNGADKVSVVMTDAAGNEVKTQSSSAEKDTHTLTFTPAATGTYTFKAIMIRDGETDKIGAATKSFDFKLPLAAPVMKSVTSSGNGSAAVKWNETPEADGYVVTAVKTGDTKAAATAETTELKALLTGLTVGERYSVSVAAKRGSEVSKASEPIEVIITQEAQREWIFATYGASTNTEKNGYEGSINEGTVTVYSEGGKGKIQPESHDGLAFYYTEIDPDSENFTLTADIHVDSWTYSNAQEGFGLMAADAVGVNGSSATFYNNSIQAVASKIEYYFDGTGATNDTSATKISMKLGLGYIIKSGLTAQDVADINAGTKQLNQVTTIANESGTLEVSAGSLGAGTYNLFGNYSPSKQPDGTNIEPLLTDIRLQIQRNNTGYVMRYLDQDNHVIGEKLFYDLERTALTQIDAEHIYVGFFAARNARITVSNMTFTTVAPEDDEAAKGREIEYIYPNYTIESAAVSNSSDYTLVYYGNADGSLTIVDGQGNVLADAQHVMANTKNPFPTVLTEGENTFTVTFVPDADYKPSEFQMLNSYEPATFTHTVTYSSFNAEQNIYVAPGGTGDGSRYDPTDIYTAVKFAKPGQYILLAGGVYALDSTVKVERGIDGTEENKIYMIADPETEGRPVFDFGGNCAGMIFAGDYWYFQGFDVTGSKNGEKGVQVSGDHNVLDQIHTYKNGNTGIQISRYKGTDEFADWPSYNLILNCTSYLNADSGYEDADGFAAKLTVGDGNVFDGCISAYNADDGWDLFAKVQTGNIGTVTIQNSIAFKNGYVLKKDGVLDLGGEEVDAGNGNGFKMGGDSLSGHHTLINSIAFCNKAKGIDSNSCPDIQVYRSTSFDNESYNVAFYTNNAPNTDFYGEGILSLKETNTVLENLKPQGSQDENKIYSDLNYYFNGSGSENKSGSEASLDWFVRRDVENAMFLLTDEGRNADGSINMQGLLALTDAAPEGVGARMTGNSSEALSGLKKPELSKAEVTEGIPEGSVPKDVLDKVGCSDVKELQEHLGQDIMSSADAKEILGSNPEGTQVYEVEVQVSLDGGKTWVAATADNFPGKGVDVTIPYPVGTDRNGFDFVVSHLIVLGCNGQEPGAIEYLTPRKTNSGLVVHVMSASPFTVGWKAADAQKEDNAGENDPEENEAGGNDIEENDEQDVDLTAENQKDNVGRSKSPKTGDTGTGVYDNAALEKIAAKVNDVTYEPAGAEGDANRKAEASAADVVIRVGTQTPVAGMVYPNGESRVFGWLLAAAAVLLTLGLGGTVIWERKRSEREE